MNRRDALLFGATSLAGAGVALSRGAASGQILYTSGDSIATPAGPVRVNGWKLEFDPKNLGKYSVRNPDRKITYTLVMPGELDAPAIEYGPGESSIPILAGVDKKDEKWTMRGFPHSHYYRYLDVEEGMEHKVVSHVSHPIKFKYYTNACADNPYWCGLFSEVPLKEDDFRGICNVMDRFNGFIHANVRVYIADIEETDFDRQTGYKFSRRGVADTANRRVLVAANSFLRSAVPDEGSISVFHELFHYFFDEIRYERDQKSNREISLAYDKLFAANGRLQQPGPVFDVFCETDYFGDTLFEIGHPWDNHDELFASIGTIFGFFPQEFIQRISTKDKKSRKAARVCLEAIERLDADGKNIERLLPAYKQLAAAVK